MLFLKGGRNFFANQPLSSMNHGEGWRKCQKIKRYVKLWTDFYQSEKPGTACVKKSQKTIKALKIKEKTYVENIVENVNNSL